MAEFDFSLNIGDNKDEIMKALSDAVAVGLEAIGLTAEGYAKRYCPVDTGRLRNSITHGVENSAAYIGSNVEYAPYVELGTSTGRQPRPYLRPAIQNHVAEYKKLMEDALKS